MRRTTAFSAAACLLVVFDGVGAAVEDRVARGVALCLGVFRFAGLLDR
ncbi:hypothetical protein [Actinoallomurus rhizosphaericola]|nr:hypothetical protein [Actinoallomurus rhizosphaericola]MCO5994711.1 hypothetical protein [Actinoallomurus rhizosphaericola]